MILPPEDVTRNRLSRKSRQKALERGQGRKGKRRRRKGRSHRSRPRSLPRRADVAVEPSRRRRRWTNSAGEPERGGDRSGGDGALRGGAAGT